MASTENRFTEQQRVILRDIARASISEGLKQGRALWVDTVRYESELTAPGACFVTLYRLGQLRGCIGSLEAYRPLVEDVAENAYAAAFRDPRFSPLMRNEFDNLAIHLSVLSPPSPIQFSDEADLLEQIRPNVDGLVLEDQGHRGTFLPSVWEQLPEKEDFLAALKS